MIYRIHQAVTVNLSNKPMATDMLIYGRVWDRDGGTIHVMSPHGALYKAGCLWVRPITATESFAKFREWEEKARADLGWIYCKNSTSSRDRPWAESTFELRAACS